MTSMTLPTTWRGFFEKNPPENEKMDVTLKGNKSQKENRLQTSCWFIYTCKDICKECKDICMRFFLDLHYGIRPSIFFTEISYFGGGLFWGNNFSNLDLFI